MRRSVIMILAATLLGCASNSPPPPPVEPPLPDDRPDDFVLAATVYSPQTMREARIPRSLRPARYIVEPDGSLRAAVGPGADATTYPGRTRQLTPAQFDTLWRSVRTSGLLDPDNPARENDPEVLTRSSDRTTALIYVGFNDRRITLRVLLDRAGPGAVETEKLIDRLAEWAWIKD